MGRDRTQEFFTAVESLVERAGGQSSSHLISSVKSRTEFTKASSLISKQINETIARLTKLTVLAKKKSMFEDKPMEINELIYIIKQDMAKINHQIGQLSEYLGREQQVQNSKQTKQHSFNVISSLQSKLASTSDAFKTVLKTRSENLKLQKERRDQYSYQDQSGTTRESSSSPLYNPERKPTRNAVGAGSPPNYNQSQPGYSQSSSSSAQNQNQGQGNYAGQPNQYGGSSQSENSNSDTIVDFGSTSFTQQLLQDPNQNSAYAQARDQTIESIESTIAELGQVYSRFASVLAEQREMVQRIDENVGNVQDNVEGAHGQLLKYYQGISSNRGLMLKSIGVVVVFFTMFVVLT